MNEDIENMAFSLVTTVHPGCDRDIKYCDIYIGIMKIVSIAKKEAYTECLKISEQFYHSEFTAKEIRKKMEELK